MSNIRKAIASSIVALGTGVGAIALDGEFKILEILVVVGGTLVAFGTTWGVPNDTSSD